jgi:hypothetical protein
MLSRGAEDVVYRCIQLRLTGIGEGLLQEVGEITAIGFIENLKTGKIGPGKRGSCSMAGLQGITKAPKRKLRKMLTVQLEFESAEPESVRLIRPFARDRFRLRPLDALPKAAAHGSKRPNDLFLPMVDGGSGAIEDQMIKLHAAVCEP